jgi:chemotaxis protein methyltransferase CheR
VTLSKQDFKYIRDMLHQHEMKLAQPWPRILPMDIVLMRNVLIYFDLETKRGILAKIREMLKPDGYLFLGGGDSTLRLDDCFKAVQIEKSTCYRLQDG